ncbi:hypothetical protein J4458_02500 [Candidatus Woesearchaeota archaeon]|nr:hypothetical protein [Candidatus Woesearchaeota archaeon]
MLRQNMQAGLLPEKYIIGVTYKDIRLKTVAKREEASVATRLRICLERIIKIGVHGGFSSDLESLTKLSKKLLEDYIIEVQRIIGLVEYAIQKSGAEHLKLVRKIDSLLNFILQTEVQVLRLEGKYPFDIKKSGQGEALRNSVKDFDGLCGEIKETLKGLARDIGKEQSSEKREARGALPFKPLRLYLFSKQSDELRNAAREGIYILNEDGFMAHLGRLMQSFSREKEIIELSIENFYREKWGHVQGSIYDIPKWALREKELEQRYNELLLLVYRFVYDVKNLLDFYKRHFHSVTNLEIDLNIEEAEMLREMESISRLLDKLPKNMDVFFTQAKARLFDLEKRIRVFAQYEYWRETYFDKTIAGEYVKSRMLGIEKREYSDVVGKVGPIHRFRLNIQGARGTIAGDVYLKDPSRIPDKGVIIATSLTSYRKLHSNLADSIANDNYLVYIFDLPSHGESRGGFGYAEISENILRIASYLKQRFGLKSICTLGHSTGGTAAIFSIMHYDLEVDLALKKVEKQIEALLLQFPKKGNLDQGFIERLRKEELALKEELKAVIIRSYNKWPEHIDVIGMLNPMLYSFYQRAGISKNLLTKILSSPIGPIFFKTSIERVKIFEDATMRHHEAFKRLLRMKKKSDPERYSELKRLKPVLVKGISAFDKDLFFEEFINGITVLDYLRMVRRYYPEALRRIYSIPKLFLYSEDDEVTLYRKNIGLYTQVPKEFSSSEIINLSGVLHSLNYRGQVMYENVPIDNTVLNYLHYHLKFHL